LQVLERVDGFDLTKIFGQPCDATFRLAILDILDEIGDIVLTERTIEDRKAFDYRDLHFVDPGEEQTLPFFLCSFFEGQFEVRVLVANELREFIEGRKVFVF
jgi:hypothetical protein